MRRDTGSEKSVERALVVAAACRGAVALKFTSPGAAGVPDRIVLAPGGRVAFVELKRPRGGRVSALQRRVHQLLEGLGFRVEVVTSRDGVDTFLNDWLGPVTEVSA